VVAMSDVRPGDVGVAVQNTRRPFQTKPIVWQLKSQRIGPSDSNHHIIGPQGEAIAVDVEVFLPNGDLQVGAAAGAGQTIPICHCDTQTGSTLQMDPDALRHVGVDEVMRGA
jgi:hypothetical protein